MSYWELIDFSRMPAFLIWLLSFVLLNILSIWKKKCIFSLITLIFSVSFLIIHIGFKSDFQTVVTDNIVFDFIFLVISIIIYIYIDEIESRRKVISEVFENRYKKRSKK